MKSLLTTLKQVALADLTPHPRNVRKGNVEVIAESLKANGQFRPILVQKSTGHVLAGNHTLAAAQSLGWDKLAVSYVDVDDDAALRILLADNRTSELGENDNEQLAALLRDLDGFEGTGYDDDYASSLFAQFEDVPSLDEEPEEEEEEENTLQDYAGHYQLVFDDDDQRQDWNKFMRWLRDEFPDAETNTERIMLFVRLRIPEQESD